MLKPCEACEHPERTAVEEALSRGESYRELTKRFGVSIGQLKRHRKAHIGRDDPAQPDSVLADADDWEGEEEGEECYLRLGHLPKGGLSFNTVEEEYEEGISVYSARKTARGYIFDVPCEGRYLSLCLTLLYLTLDLRPVFEASGTFVVEGIDGEPLLEDATLKPVSPLRRIDMPDWWGEPGREYADAWNRQRRRRAGRGKGGAWEVLEKEALEVSVQLQSILVPRSPLNPFRSRAELLEKARIGLRKNRPLRAGEA